MLDTPLADPIGLMTVMAVRGVGGATAEKALARFTTLREMHEASPAECKGILNANIAAAFRDPGILANAHEQAMRAADEADRLQAVLLTPWNDGYPERLRGIHERPLVLYTWGDLSCTERSVACVGTRDPSWFGEEVTRRLGGYLADNGWAIVSGLARGIDHVAHETALAHDARTVAVLGSGLDALASERQRDLLQRILDAGGAAVTEQPFGREADPGSLIKRNRIQSGLALATFVMQSKRTSGTMQTARYTLMQDRALYVPVPPGAHAEEEVSQGNLMLAYGTGPDLAEAIGAKNSFVDLVRERWSDRPPASPIANRNDYARVLAELEARLGAAPAAEAEEAMSPAPR